MIYKIWLSNLKGLSPANKRKLVLTAGGFKNAYLKLSEEKRCASLEEAKRIEEECLQKGIFIKSFKEYGIQDFPDLPIILYCRGNWQPYYDSIGIVGTRKCTEYGKKVTTETATKLAYEGVTIISGMAKGIDGYAHSAAIKAGGYTIAVLGNGPDICFPSEHRSLMDAILKTGLIISEYPPGFHGSNSTFPQRNRIIAAFSDRILVVESGKKGGALITAEKARFYGKEVYAVPGRIDSPESEGTNELIADNKARLWLREKCKSEDRQLSLALNSQETDYNNGAIVDLLKERGGKMTAEELSIALKRTKSKIFEEITELEINDIVRTEGEIIWLR